MKKALQIIKNIVVWAIVALAVFMMIFTVVSVSTFNRNDRNLFGFRAYIVTSDSMSKSELNANDPVHFNAGDLIFTKYVDPQTLQEGDIITYQSQGTENFGETITHKIRKLTTDAEGNPGFITYGTNTGNDDATVVTYPYILGKYQAKAPLVGHFFMFLKTPQGYIVCIFIPFALLILYQGIKCIKLFRRYKKEQMEEMQAEKDQIAAEREENAKMLAELKALKEQLAAGGSAPAQESAPAVETPAVEDAPVAAETPAEAPAAEAEETPVNSAP